MDFPTLDELKEIMNITVTNKSITLSPVLTGDDIIAAKKAIRDIPMAEAVEDYALRIVVATHPEVAGADSYVQRYVACGASPRAGQAIFQSAKAKAMLEGRFNVSFDDIKAVAFPALRHRIVPGFEAMADGIKVDEIIANIIASVPMN